MSEKNNNENLENIENIEESVGHDDPGVPSEEIAEDLKHPPSADGTLFTKEGEEQIPEEEIAETTETIEITEITEEKPLRKKISFKDSIFGTAAILAAVCVVTVFFISLFNDITTPVINQRMYDEKVAAIERLFGANVLFVELRGYEDIYSDFEAPVTEIILVVDENRLGDDKIAGYCVMVAPKGFTDSIIMLVAINPNLTVREILILSMSETVGYGTKLESEGWFQEQFWNKGPDIRL